MSSTLADHVPGGSNTLADELNFPERPTSAGGCRLTESGPFKSLTHLFPFSLSFGPLHSFSSTTLLFSSLLGYCALKYAASTTSSFQIGCHHRWWMSVSLSRAQLPPLSLPSNRWFVHGYRSRYVWSYRSSS